VISKIELPVVLPSSVGVTDGAPVGLNDFVGSKDIDGELLGLGDFDGRIDG